MRPFDTSPALAHAHDLDVRRRACDARLVALAHGCREFGLARTLRRTGAVVTRRGVSAARDCE
jgi:hypothetical protein